MSKPVDPNANHGHPTLNRIARECQTLPETLCTLDHLAECFGIHVESALLRPKIDAYCDRAGLVAGPAGETAVRFRLDPSRPVLTPPPIAILD